jgi:hypothetical protein
VRFEFIVSVEVERIEGKFASRDELAEQIQEALDNADPGELEGEAGGSYQTVTWGVQEEAQQKAKKLVPHG